MFNYSARINRIVDVKKSKTGKYGRWIADVTLPDNRDLVRVMLDEGFQKRVSY